MRKTFNNICHKMKNLYPQTVCNNFNLGFIHIFSDRKIGTLKSSIQKLQIIKLIALRLGIVSMYLDDGPPISRKKIK